MATYNRVLLLEHLYNSIVEQDYSDVEMVIVNDGSTDATEDFVMNWIDESKVQTQYFYQKNTGRGAALRKALLNANGKYSIIMDDDDYFLDGAFNIIKNAITDCENHKILHYGLAGICCLCLDENGDVVGDEFPVSKYISNFLSLRVLDDISGDKKEIVRTSILKKYIFPHFENESRVVSSTLWYRISYDFDCLCLNYPIAIKRYIKGGMSDSLMCLKAESPNYQIEDCIITINYPRKFNLQLTILYSIILWKYWFFGGKLSLSRIKFEKLPILFFCLPIGLIFYLKDLILIQLIKSNGNYHR